MRANAIVQEGKSFAAKEVDLPLLQEHQVYVRVSHAAFNPTDRLALDVNAFGDGAVLGCDFAGEVVEAHPSVTKFAKGSGIAGFIWGGEIPGLGAYSSHTIADERLSFKIPESISAAEASTVLLAANTAWLALFSPDCLSLPRNPSNGDPILIWGGSSVVGYFAIQLAKLHGYKVITTCSPRNFDGVKVAGATHVFDYNDEEAIARIREAVPNLEYVFDTIGNATSSANASKALKDSTGRLCTVRPGKANTENVPSTVEVSDVFVFTAFPTAHSYRGKAHWPVNIPNHELSIDLHDQLPKLFDEGDLRPPNVNILGSLSPNTVAQAMDLNRDGKVSAEKVVFKVDY
ncbi:Trans-enoyl reductase ACTTS2 [Colletotrichum siamense]|uniref:Trans-enoyl reductase ACTTS2 n=1 Tax=Colletotrichum siamense TaxID=690259 RepID=A0A9P5BMG6_COLSI|nr:Trans-enoyl reductase ACTTS2 [Colletotrichum siamense]KAF4844743.1 Trans-enoyl reductase ACTTS2 [Colletotrichum siamense]